MLTLPPQHSIGEGEKAWQRLPVEELLLGRRSRRQAPRAVAGTTTFSVLAADRSDTSLSVRYGTKFAEPYDNNPDGSRIDVKKTIIGLTHADGYKYGSNFFNVDVLLSDRKDPGGGTPGASGAQEVYLVYQHTLDLGRSRARS